jgi:putative proteasome-type protease
MESTMRSNLGVGLPIDVLVLRRDTLKPELNYRIDAEDEYFSDLRHRWSEALREAHLAIPKPPYKTNGTR